MKPKKSLLITLSLLILTGLFNSCDPLEQTRTSCWKLIDTEIWWVEPIDGNPPLEKIAAIPFDQTFTRSVNWQTVYTGAEYNITRTDKFNGAVQGSINYTWSQFPSYIDPGVKFDCNIESKGTAGNGIGVSNYATQIGGYPGGYGVWTQSFKDGMKTAKLTIDEPSDKTVSSKMKFVVGLWSGGYFYIDYYYIYEWIPE